MAQGNSFLHGTLILTIAGMVVKVIGSLNWIILSRVLGGEGMGLYQMAFPIYLLALSLSSAGIPVAISIITAEKVAIQDYQGVNRVFKLSILLMTVSGIALGLLVYFGAGWLIEHQIIRDNRAYWSILALAPAIFFVTMLSSFRGYLQGWQLMTPTAVSQIVEQILRVVAMIGFSIWLLPYGIDYAAGGASLGAGIGAASGLAVLVYYYKRLKQRVIVEDRRKKQSPVESTSALLYRMVKLALPVSFTSIMLPLVANLDLLIVPFQLEKAGYAVNEATELFGYLTGMAVPLMNLATVVTAAMATSLVPAIADAKAINNGHQISQKIAASIRLANLVTIPASIGLWVLATPMAELVYHAPQAGEVIRVVAVGIYLLGIHQVTTSILQGIGHTLLPVINMAFAALVKVVLNWILTAMPDLGILGAAWATNADIGVAMVMNLWFVSHFVNFHMDLRMFWKNIVAAIVMGVIIDALYIFLTAQGLNDIWATISVILLAVAIYGVVLLVLGGVTGSDVAKIPLVGSRLAFWLRKHGIVKT